MAATLSRSLVKIGIAGGAIAATTKAGLWSNGETSTKSLTKVKKSILVASNEEEQVIVLEEKTVAGTIGSAWNSGIKTTFSAVYSAPEAGCTYVKKFINQYIDQPQNSKS